MVQHLWLWLGVGLALGCASAPDLPFPGRSGLSGEVRLVPRDGVTPGGAAGGSYGDRRMRDVAFVDYARPGYTVVYTEGAPQGGRSRLAIRAGTARTRIDPAHSALGVGGIVEVRNETPTAHVVSLPALGFLRRLEPGETAEVAPEAAGELEVFLLDTAEAAARIFVAPGPYAATSHDGRYTLPDLPPGRHRIDVWHPRFPPASQWTELPADSVVNLDFELSVQGLPTAEGERAAAP